MTLVRSLDELRTAAGNVLFEGGNDGVALSFFHTSFAPGGGPPPHRHPYAEVFLVQEGVATFTVDGEDRGVTPEHVVVVPAQAAHTFRNSGDGTLRVLSIHPSGEVVQIDVA